LPDALGASARGWLQSAAVHQLVIGDERLAAADGASFETLDPATGRAIGRVAQTGREDVDRAVRAAREALRSGPWASIAPSARADAIYALADALQQHAEEITQLEALDNGKPVKLAQAVDVELSAAHLRYFAGWPTKIEGAVLPVTPAPSTGAERASAHQETSARRSPTMIRPAASISARWEKACGKFPRWRPVPESSSSA
jgi:acyl-CoA reductase-like NAD-dependent aldehyde dehydrogenase